MEELRELVGRVTTENYELRELIDNLREQLATESAFDQKLAELLKTLSSGNYNREDISKLEREIKDAQRNRDALLQTLSLKEQDSWLMQSMDEKDTSGIGCRSVSRGGSARGQGRNRSMSKTENAKDLDTSSPRTDKADTDTTNVKELLGSHTGGQTHFLTAQQNMQKRKGMRKRRVNRVVHELRQKVISQKKKVNPMPKKMLLRLITTFYEELSKAFRNPPAQHPNSISAFVYSVLMNKYGLKNVADKKFLQVSPTLHL